MAQNSQQLVVKVDANRQARSGKEPAQVESKDPNDRKKPLEHGRKRHLGNVRKLVFRACKGERWRRTCARGREGGGGQKKEEEEKRIKR